MVLAQVNYYAGPIQVWLYALPIATLVTIVICAALRRRKTKRENITGWHGWSLAMCYGVMTFIVVAGAVAAWDARGDAKMLSIYSIVAWTCFATLAITALLSRMLRLAWPIIMVAFFGVFGTWWALNAPDWMG